MSAPKVYSATDVAAHNSAKDLWIIVRGQVFDLTEFQNEHPGGKKILAKVAGTDATESFNKYHSDTIFAANQKLAIGVVEGANPPAKL
ncbi:hypothetical protein CXG81DRAFT_24191 [Caulochytrium protostelioides]|uniref:Cytochrome b5 heme-binding domain-containing protein n=1 Tax=Caulochytrium protostelioides TaxID=1555241 RepID=A0A4P9XDD2_9FUNG|nr:hypothetical protein CXG81DRAFT_24191 [Caulochytrium protostelioides]|eukprot:RKP03190.1 hypothetical protein CXG81DRAFT_24191 [Caulochytrium protostelioides]